MNADLLDDLKQFIDSRLSQTEARFDEKLDTKLGELHTEIHELRTEMWDGFAGVADTIDTMYGDIDQRLTALENHPTR